MLNGKKEINIRIGANIKRQREKAGFTQEVFSEMIGLNTKSLSAAERGIVGISLTTLERICKVLSISADELLFGKKEKNNLDDMVSRLEQLAPRQFAIAHAVLCNLLAAFSLEE